MGDMDLQSFTDFVEAELLTLVDDELLPIDDEGDWHFTTAGGSVWVRVLDDPDLHVHVFSRVAEAVTAESWSEINRLNSIMTAGALVLTDDSTIIAMMRLHRSMTNRESLGLVIDAMGTYIRDLGPMFEIVHGGGEPLPRPTTPDRIESLVDGHVFVFGSNALGQHGSGAARLARERFGAVPGIGEGLQGQSYALPTMEGPEAFAAAAARFVDLARSRPDLTFWLTKVGCGIAGYAEDDVKARFADTSPNVVKPPGW